MLFSNTPREIGGYFTETIMAVFSESTNSVEGTANIGSVTKIWSPHKGQKYTAKIVCFLPTVSTQNIDTAQ